MMSVDELLSEVLPEGSVPASDTSSYWQWNHRIHEEWAKERLYFWRIGFSPVYDRGRVVEALDDAMRQHNLLSYAIYELTGLYDLMVRVWLPATTTHEDFESTLRTCLSGANLQSLDVFIVSRIVMHWIWALEGSRSLKVPPDARLRERLTADEIDRINNGRLSEEDAEQYVNENLIRPFTPCEGIKFFLAITPPVYLPSISARERLRAKIWGLLDAASDMKEVSLYQGNGFAQILILGRVPYYKFHSIGTDLIDTINSMDVGAFFGVRTYTHICPGPGFLEFADRIPASVEGSRTVSRSVEEYFSEGESQRTEIKGSAFVDLEQWLFVEPSSKGEARASDRVTNEGVLKAVIGMLNADGGTVVIGALEHTRIHREPALSRLEGLPIIGNYVLCGIELDKQGHDWDGYQRKLMNILNSRIMPSPGSWLTVERQQFSGVEFCVISVRPSSSHWFYAKDDPRFYVRQGSSTIPLSGIDADNFKRDKQRG